MPTTNNFANNTFKLECSNCVPHLTSNTAYSAAEFEK